MVLWEITLATAYFLGLKRTYRLALRIQKRVIGSKHPKIREFVHRRLSYTTASCICRRIHSVFDAAVRVHKNIQQRDIEVGRNLGNWILRWLDRMKPSAEINPSSKINKNNFAKQVPNSTDHLSQRLNTKLTDRDSKGKLLFSPLRTKSFPTIAVIMKPIRPVGMNHGQYRQISHVTSAYRMSSGGVFRSDIALWMMQN